MTRWLVMLWVGSLLWACAQGQPPAPGDGGTASDAGGGSGDGGCGDINWTDTVSPIVQGYCLPCHGAPPTYGAPASLVTYADTQQLSVENAPLLEYQAMAKMLAAHQMPASGPAPSQGEIDLVLAWADAGAPYAACPGTDAGVLDAGQGGVQDAGLIDTSSANYKTTANGYVDEPDAGIEDNDYECFSFTVNTGGGTVEATQFAPIVDNATILHHIVLYSVSTTDSLPSNYQCFGGPIPTGDTGSAAIAYIWVPGVGPWTFPSQTGLPIHDGDQFVMQIHYHNFTGLPQTDSSGIAVWWTTTPREYPAAVIRLGPTGFMLEPQQTDVQVSGTCNVGTSVATLHVFGAMPHMHLYGTQIATQLLSGGTTTTLADVSPWNFNNQQIFTEDVDINPGDQLVTTCHYDTESAPGPVYFGETTEDEMCFDFLYAYPLTSGTVPANCN